MYCEKMNLTISASSGTIFGKPSSPFSYPRKTDQGRPKCPSCIAFRLPHVTFSEMERDSSCDKLDKTVNRISTLGSNVQIFSFSKYTSVPCSFSFLMLVRLSTVLRANLLTDFVIIKSIFPAHASAIIRLKPSLCRVLTAVMPSSVNRPAKIQSLRLLI